MSTEPSYTSTKIRSAVNDPYIHSL